MRAYLIAIVRNLYLNSRRHAARDVPLDDTHVVADVAASIDARIEQRETLARVRTLVDDFLARDPEFARLVRAAGHKRQVTPHTVEPGPDAERMALNETLRALRRKRWTHALALFCTLVPFTFTFSGTTVTFFMLRDRPEALVFLVPAAALWWSYFRQSRVFREHGWHA